MPSVATACHLLLAFALGLGACPGADAPAPLFGAAQVGEFVNGILGVHHGYEVQQCATAGHPNDSYAIICRRARHVTADEGIFETIVIANRGWPRRFASADYLLETSRVGLTTTGITFELSTSAVSFFGDHAIGRSCPDRDLRAFITRCEGQAIADTLSDRPTIFSSAEITWAELRPDGLWRLHWESSFKDFLATDQQITIVGFGCERS